MVTVNDSSKYRIVLVTILFSGFLSVNAIAQELNPKQYFGDSYTEAVEFFIAKRVDIDSVFSQYNIQVDEAIAIVFPEVIRYNRFRDFAETYALELAYVNGGKEFADFSIGHFQMKPSFVENLESELSADTILSHQFKRIISYSLDMSLQDIRRERINRLKQFSWQIQYLACFIRLAEKRFASDLKEKSEERLLILSSAYNMGLNSNYKDLKILSETKTFPYGKSIMGRFSYYDVANYFYTHGISQTSNLNQ